ncbi:RagB/SusD family nutrient uptake outer membrane protein [Pedobacter cryoconitis]|uniref:RagB/SusD family nutrient uptake outer membrane protein n=1 Tax=Pedobacter cryoconitis TaxID=188932 RepID=UPI00160E40EC|nr:RagB/SusD family nutrient uptake outer membrane protein [Pedobacter cryoconitis]MBB5644610.1 hypothetical protein [Pedobacter cryoconitis]
MTIKRNLNSYTLIFALMLMCVSCKDMIAIPDPINTITTDKVFDNDNQANSAMTGTYSQLINAEGGISFGSGSITLLGSMGADELRISAIVPSPYYINKIPTDDGDTRQLWIGAYRNIYNANAVIEGISASTSPKLHTEFRIKLTAEAKFLRAYSYFYLVNLFGDVPMALSADFNQTSKMSRTPKAEVYAQIIKDLQDAKANLAGDFSGSKLGERIRANKWAATAMLARVYLFTGDYANAAAAATEVINQTALFELKSDLTEVFLMNNKEAIWQLQQSNLIAPHGNATPEGYAFKAHPSIIPGEYIGYRLTDELVGEFEDQDKRKTSWLVPVTNAGTTTYYVDKYKIGFGNSAVNGPITEYYTMLRLAEQYLIRAEALTLGNSQLDLAIADLNVIRARAGVTALPLGLSKPEIVRAIEKERRTEFFAEWGHRWLDLKRTGRAHDVLSTIPVKQPWAGDYQLLYPIPVIEIQTNNNLTQNPGY